MPNRTNPVKRTNTKRIFADPVASAIPVSPTPTPSTSQIPPTPTPTPTPSSSPSVTPSPTPTPSPPPGTPYTFFLLSDIDPINNPDRLLTIFDPILGDDSYSVIQVANPSTVETSMRKWRYTFDQDCTITGFNTRLLIANATPRLSDFRAKFIQLDSNGIEVDSVSGPWVPTNEILLNQIYGENFLYTLNISEGDSLILDVQTRTYESGLPYMFYDTLVDFRLNYFEIYSNDFAPNLPTPTPTPTPSVTPTISLSASITPTPTPTSSVTPTPTPSLSVPSDDPCSIFFGYTGNRFYNRSGDDNILLTTASETVDFSGLMAENGDIIVVSAQTYLGIEDISGFTKVYDQQIIDDTDVTPEGGVAYDSPFRRQVFTAEFGTDILTPSMFIQQTPDAVNYNADFVRITINVIRNGNILSINNYNNFDQGSDSILTFTPAPLPTANAVRYYIISFDGSNTFRYKFSNLNITNLQVKEFTSSQSNPSIIEASDIGAVYNSSIGDSGFFTAIAFSDYFDGNLDIEFEWNLFEFPTVCSVTEILVGCGVNDPPNIRRTSDGSLRVGNLGRFIHRKNY